MIKNSTILIIASLAACGIAETIFTYAKYAAVYYKPNLLQEHHWIVLIKKILNLR